MRLIDAEMFAKQLKRISIDAKAKKQSYSAYEKILKILNDVPTANPTCPDCGTVLAGEIHERQEADTKAD